MKNHVISLEISVARLAGNPEKLKATGSMKIVTRGRAGKIDVLQDKRETIGTLPEAIQTRLSNIIQEIEDYYNDVQEVAGGEITMAGKKKSKNRPHVEERVVEDFDDILPEDDPAHNYVPGRVVEDPDMILTDE